MRAFLAIVLLALAWALVAERRQWGWHDAPTPDQNTSEAAPSKPPRE